MPGEAVNRKYTWPEGVTSNPLFRFGGVDKVTGGESGGVKAALDFFHGPDGKVNPTHVAPSALSDYRSVAHDALGKSRNYCQGTENRTPARGFGIVSAGANDTAAACINGAYSGGIDAMRPDRDLGRCDIVGRRNVWPDEKRKFGVPSIRTDIAAPAGMRGLADNQNYGDEVGAGRNILKSFRVP